MLLQELNNVGWQMVALEGHPIFPQHTGRQTFQARVRHRVQLARDQTLEYRLSTLCVSGPTRFISGLVGIARLQEDLSPKERGEGFLGFIQGVIVSAVCE